MPFNLLVTTCACKGQKWRYEPKDGAKIIIDAFEKEHVVFFEIDEKSNGTSQFREYFQMEEDCDKICDLLIFYFAESKKFDIKRDSKIICLAESKSQMSDEAIKQIGDTYKHLSKFFSKGDYSDTKCYNKPIIWCAYIATTGFGGAPSQKVKEYRKKLNKISGIKYGKVSEKEDIGLFLRDCYTKIEKEKRK